MLVAFVTQATEGVPKYRGVCSTILCYLKNPKVRVLLDSGAEISMIDRASSLRVGISGENFNFSLNVAGGAVDQSLKTDPDSLRTQCYCRQ